MPLLARPLRRLAPAALAALLAACDRGARPAPPAEGAPSAPAAPAASAPPGDAVEPAAPSATPPLRWNAPAPEAAPALRAIAGSILVDGRSYALLRELTDGFGPRLTGSAVHAGAARWAADALRAMGVDEAHLEEFPLEAGWQRGPVTLRALGPGGRELSAQAVAWSPPPPGGAVTAELVRARSLPEAARRARDFAGKALFLSGRGGAGAGLAARQKALKALADAGVVALFSRGSRPNNVGNARSCASCAGLVAPAPLADVGLEDAAWLDRRLDEGKVTVSFANESRLTGPVRVPNVVAEWRGRERPDEYVLVTAHLDAWDYATGAQDNGAGVAQVLEAARAVVASGQRPRRSIRFALWAGEEQGLFGSRAYVKAHASELDRVAAVVNTDHGAGAPRAWRLAGRADLVASFGPAAERLFAGLGPDELNDDFECDTDHCPFALEGVPTFDLEADDKAYNDVHHAPSDTLDKVDARELAAGAASVAVAAYALADLPDRVGPRLPHAKVTEALRAKGALDGVVAEGLYAP